MEALKGLEQHWNLLGWAGVTHPFWYVNIHTIIQTWIVLIIISLFILTIRFFLHKKESYVRYLALSFFESFIDLCTQTLGQWNFRHFSFITSLFIFILFCNCIAVIPWTEEPTRDLNTTLALGICSFFYKEFYAIYLYGFKAYISEFFHPFAVMFPLNVIGHFSKIISISFRLFGNIFGGSIIAGIYFGALSGSILFETLGILGLNFLVILFFIVFEGLIQAFVFSMLSLTYLAIAVQGGEPDV